MTDKQISESVSGDLSILYDDSQKTAAHVINYSGEAKVEIISHDYKGDRREVKVPLSVIRDIVEAVEESEIEFKTEETQ